MYTRIMLKCFDVVLITTGNDICNAQENYIWNFIGANVTNYYFDEIVFTNAILVKRYSVIVAKINQKFDMHDGER